MLSIIGDRRENSKGEPLHPLIQNNKLPESGKNSDKNRLNYLNRR